MPWTNGSYQGQSSRKGHENNFFQLLEANLFPVHLSHFSLLLLPMNQTKEVKIQKKIIKVFFNNTLLVPMNKVVLPPNRPRINLKNIKPRVNTHENINHKVNFQCQLDHLSNLKCMHSYNYFCALIILNVSQQLNASMTKTWEQYRVF